MCSRVINGRHGGVFYSSVGYADTFSHKRRLRGAVHRRGVREQNRGEGTPVSEPNMCAEVCFGFGAILAHIDRALRERFSDGKFGTKIAEREIPLRYFGAGSRSRTGTVLSYHGILSPGRLPIPPFRHFVAMRYNTTHELFCQGELRKNIFFLCYLSLYALLTSVFFYDIIFILNIMRSLCIFKRSKKWILLSRLFYSSSVLFF